MAALNFRDSKNDGGAKTHGIAALDQLGSAVLVVHAAQHPVLEQLNQKLEARSDTLRRRIAVYVGKAHPARLPGRPGGSPRQCRRGKPTSSARQTCCGCLSSGRFLGDMVETMFCRRTVGVRMSRSSLVWGPFSVVWAGAGHGYRAAAAESG